MAAAHPVRLGLYPQLKYPQELRIRNPVRLTCRVGEQAYAKPGDTAVSITSGTNRGRPLGRLEVCCTYDNDFKVTHYQHS